MNFFQECLIKTVGCFKCGLKECECDALDKSQIARDEQSRKETLHAERDAQLENDPEYGPWLDSL